ncbi:hypothetical protein ACFRCG_41745 [Embleya sp. NPDC056575]|uniref:hypothetical protein n=1 Tax=unclassified Embleya TaxID=2699296 RepID=UPI0036BDC50E
MPAALTGALLAMLALIGLLAVSPSLPPRTVHRLALELACIWAAIAAAAALYTH